MGTKIGIGTDHLTEVFALDAPGFGNARHVYVVVEAGKNPFDPTTEELANVEFQNGPVKEEGINGCHNEDLIAIVIDRLEGFQSGQFKCEENGEALLHLQAALAALNSRTAKRKARGVEGTRQL